MLGMLGAILGVLGAILKGIGGHLGGSWGEGWEVRGRIPGFWGVMDDFKVKFLWPWGSRSTALDIPRNVQKIAKNLIKIDVFRSSGKNFGGSAGHLG